jgi:hypothetical protein
MLLVLCALLQISPQDEPLLAAPVLLPAPPPAIRLTRNSHATAVAWVVKYLGAARPGELDDTLVAAAYVCIRGCPTCEGNESPAWDISHGLALLLADRGRASAVTEAYRCSPEGGEVATPARWRRP